MTEVDAVVIGGGPAGSTIGRLLADWGHSVVILASVGDASRGMAESLPPSTRKLLSAIGVLDKIEQAGFRRTTGNTVWWGAREGRVEYFPAPDDEPGFQVLRPDLDHLLLENARDAGARVFLGAKVTGVRLEDDAALVEFEKDGASGFAGCRFAIDCSGRAGAIARHGFRRHEPRFQMQALVGGWTHQRGWNLPDESHTVVETFEDGWAWSVPTSPGTRQVAVMVDGAVTDLQRGPTLESTYCRQLSKANCLASLTRGAELRQVWACDASLYDSRQYGGTSFLLVGDAASRIDPLSSFGVKKALASAWVGAVAAHTAMTDPDRLDAAIEMFSEREREMYASSLYHSREYAREAYARHPHSFWASRAAVDVVWRDELDEAAAARRDDVAAALRSLKERDALGLALNENAPIGTRPAIRGNEIVLEDGFLLDGHSPMRYFAGVNLIALAKMTGQHETLPELFDAYCRVNAPVTVHAFVVVLALLIAEGILVPARALV